MKKWGSFLFFLLVLSGCEKDINIHPDAQDPKLVVEGYIETGQTPIVVLTNSLDYFATVDTATLNGTYVHNAKVTITTRNQAFTLNEVKVPLKDGYFFYYYTTNQSNPFTILFGANGSKYDLKIETGGQVYTSSTTIPALAKKVDSLWWKKAPNNSDTNKVVLMARVTDPPGLGNYIRYFTRVNSDAFYPGRNSVYDDQVVDGITYDIQVDQGITKNEKVDPDDYSFFKRGDTVTVKHCNIDKATFDFWRTWEFSYQSIGNPFSSPGKVLGNISNNALGSFCGYAVQFKTLIIPK